MAIRSAANSVDVAICEDIVVASTFASVRPPGEEWSRFWETEPNGMVVTAGETGVLDQEAFGLIPTLSVDPGQEPGTELTVVFVPDAGNATINGIFQIPESGFSEERWLQVDGTETSSACNS